MNTSRPSAERRPRLRIGLLGAAGQLGRCLTRAIEASSTLDLAFATTRHDLDVADAEAIGPWLDAQASPPDFVVNAAAHTRVDACESEVEAAYRVNALAPGAWARELARRGIRFVHVSTDYVFPGDGERPYREDDPTDPKTVYGSSKRAGEIAVLGSDPSALVVRTSWVFGPGRNFPAAILDQAARRRSGELEGPIRVVDDQRGAPTYAADLADGLLRLVERAEASPEALQGLLHLSNAGETTWYGFARRILELADASDLEIVPVATSAFPTAAARPAYSLLDCSRARALGVELPSWEDAIARHLAGPDAPAELLARAAADGATAAGGATGAGASDGVGRDAAGGARS
jgi:dTDP-4-dehydrorhamnose reductase